MLGECTVYFYIIIHGGEKITGNNYSVLKVKTAFYRINSIYLILHCYFFNLNCIFIDMMYIPIFMISIMYNFIILDGCSHGFKSCQYCIVYFNFFNNIIIVQNVLSYIKDIILVYC